MPSVCPPPVGIQPAVCPSLPSMQPAVCPSFPAMQPAVCPAFPASNVIAPPENISSHLSPVYNPVRNILILNYILALSIFNNCHS